MMRQVQPRKIALTQQANEAISYERSNPLANRQPGEEIDDGKMSLVTAKDPDGNFRKSRSSCWRSGC